MICIQVKLKIGILAFSNNLTIIMLSTGSMSDLIFLIHIYQYKRCCGCIPAILPLFLLQILC
jgi:hypothetical protein